MFRTGANERSVNIERSISRAYGPFSIGWFVLFLCLTNLLFGSETTNTNQLADVDGHYQKTCISAGCHAVDLSSRMPKHSPYLEGQCLTCHRDHTSTSTTLLKSRDDAMCLPCHKEAELNAADHQLKHPAGGALCVDCHNPHQSPVRNLLRKEETRLICSKCHEPFLKKAAEYPYRHHYFDPKTECGTCHYAHQRSSNHYLRENVAETCLSCHDLPIAMKGRVLENVADRLRTAPVVHRAMEQGSSPGSPSGSCPVCHTPHGSEQPSLLKAGYPAGPYGNYQTGNYALCWQCHKSSLAEDPRGDLATNFRNGEVNLHWLHVVKIRRSRSCHLCHEAHASDKPHLMRESVMFGQWNAPLGYQASAEGGSCETPCHSKREYRRNKPVSQHPD